MQIKPLLKLDAVAFSLVNSTFILTMMSFGSVKLSIELILFCIVVCLVLTKTGDLVLHTCRWTTINARLPMAFVIGFTVISLLMTALVLIVNMPALASFWISALVILSLSFFSPTIPSRTPSDWTDSAIALLFAIIIALLVKTPASSPSILLNSGVLPIWSDYFLHGISIASFGSPFTSGGDMELAGVNHRPYHYASFMIPATLQMVSGMSGLALSTSLLLPLGLLIATFGSYAFAVELGGRLSGLLATTAIICLPVSSVFIQSGWLDFYWLLFIAPGSGYAIGVSAVVCASTVFYFKECDNRVLWLTMLLLCSLIQIRVHIFILLAPPILAVILLHRWRAHIRLLLGAMLSTILTVILALQFSTHLHTLWLEYANPRKYLDFALQLSLIYGQHISIPEYPLGLTMVFQLMFVLAAILGFYFVLYPLLFQLSMRRFGFHTPDALPLLLVLNFIGLMLFAPSSAIDGDFTEFKHRHFPLLYIVISIYTITYAFALATSYISNEKKIRPWVYGLVVSIFTTTVLLTWDSNPARPNIEAMPWARDYQDQPITPGLLEAAQYIRTHARQGDVLAMGISSTTSDPRALIVETVSLTGIPAFIARSDLKITRSQCVREIVKKRLSLLQKLSSMNNWSDAQKLLQTNGIRWFLVPPGEKQKWDSSLEFTVFSIKGISVYDAGYSASEIFKNTQC